MGVSITLMPCQHLLTVYSLTDGFDELSVELLIYF